MCCYFSASGAVVLVLVPAAMFDVKVASQYHAVVGVERLDVELKVICLVIRFRGDVYVN